MEHGKIRKAALAFAGVLLCAVLAACAGSPAPAAPLDELDAAIRETSDYLNRQLPAGSKLAILNIQSEFPALSEYIIDELTANTVNDRVFTVVDRQQIDTIRAELDFQMSGEVSDDSAQNIGQMLGAQIIVTGAVSRMGDQYRLRVRALSVQSARIEGQFNRNIPDGPTIAALAGSVATGYGSVPATTAGTAGSPTGTASASADSSAGQADSGGSSRPGLYVGSTFQARMSLYDALDWITLNAQDGGNYAIVLDRDEAVAYANLNYGGKTVTVSLKNAGGESAVSFEVSNPAYPLFTVSPGVTFILEDGIVLSGANVRNNAKNLVRIAGGSFVMNGGALKDNKASAVYVESGGFTMNGGTISGNSTGNSGGGVYIKTGMFIMNNGVISGNTTAAYGGGVYVDNDALFTMNNGSISGNTANGLGGGVYGASRCTVTKSGSGGIIYGSNAPEGQANKAANSDAGHAVYAGSSKKRNTTARVTTALDSGKDGADGGWE
jgi:TolB-like protein